MENLRKTAWFRPSQGEDQLVLFRLLHYQAALYNKQTLDLSAP